MLKNFYFYNNNQSYNPHETLALEEYFVNNIGEEDIVLYLYTHKDSVIIGKNQNARIECRYNELAEDGGILARRISGGGAVFHDLGNLNFSFITHKSNYDLHKNLEVIIDAVNSFDIKAEFSGRNDIIAQERKFSGNAFCHTKTGIFHHGTILIDSDMEKLSHYLNVSKEKIESKGISSVRSRVVNLKELNSEITVEKMITALKNSFGKIYGSYEIFNITPEIVEKTNILSKKNSNWDFLFGMTPKFDVNLKKRFTWGEIDLFLELKDARVINAQVYSDAMDACLIESIPSTLKNIKFVSSELSNALLNIKCTPESTQVLEDISNLILSQKY